MLMKKVIGIICEYNPFHNGHMQQIEYIRSKYGDDAVIVSVMSGSFVQRGLPASLPKYARAEIAVKCGVDLVIELPYPYSCSSAEYFAYAGVSVLEMLGGVDILCFGSEKGDIDAIDTAAKNMLSDKYIAYVERLKSSANNSSVSRIRLSETAYSELYGEGFPKTPNDILGVEYCKALRRRESAIVPETYCRVSGYSAGGSRELWASGDYEGLRRCVPECAFNIYKEYGAPASIDRIESLILGTFRMRKAHDGIAECRGGLDYRLHSSAMKAGSLDEFFALCSDKTYTNAKLRRLVMYCLTGIMREHLNEPPAYTLLLAASPEGCEYIAQIKKSSAIDILTKPSGYRALGKNAAEQFERSYAAEKIYTLCCSKERSAGDVIRSTPYIGSR